MVDYPTTYVYSFTDIDDLLEILNEYNKAVPKFKIRNPEYDSNYKITKDISKHPIEYLFELTVWKRS